MASIWYGSMIGNRFCSRTQIASCDAGDGDDVVGLQQGQQGQCRCRPHDLRQHDDVTLDLVVLLHCGVGVVERVLEHRLHGILAGDAALLGVVVLPEDVLASGELVADHGSRAAQRRDVADLDGLAVEAGPLWRAPWPAPPSCLPAAAVAVVPGPALPWSLAPAGAVVVAAVCFPACCHRRRPASRCSPAPPLAAVRVVRLFMPWSLLGYGVNTRTARIGSRP